MSSVLGRAGLPLGDRHTLSSPLFSEGIFCRAVSQFRELLLD
jgi:hypothetical protein